MSCWQLILSHPNNSPTNLHRDLTTSARKSDDKWKTSTVPEAFPNGKTAYCQTKFSTHYAETIQRDHQNIYYATQFPCIENQNYYFIKGSLHLFQLYKIKHSHLLTKQRALNIVCCQNKILPESNKTQKKDQLQLSCHHKIGMVRHVF